MTSVEPMTPRQLLELASLDALGLLDDVESAAYTRSFHDAPATIQDEVLRLQAEIANDHLLLAGEEPDPELRERVLRAVADALEKDDSLAPLARIGKPRRTTDRDIGGRVILGGSGQFWRAASFALAGVSLIMAYFMAMGRQASDDVTAAALWNNTIELEVLLPPLAKEFLLDESTKIDLKPVNSTDVYDASLYVNRESRQALILVSNLPAAEGKAYVLQAVAPGSPEPTLLKRFHAEAGFGGVRIDTLPANLLVAAVKWQIASIDGTVLLTSS